MTNIQEYTEEQLFTMFHPLKPNLELGKQRKLLGFLREIDEYGDLVLLQDQLNKNPGESICYLYDNKYVYVDNTIHDQFLEKFRPYIDGNQLYFDNLVNICIMVKDAGDTWAQVLTQNLPYGCMFTILDTGSTDDTIATIKRILKNKRYELYQESFLGFRDSRNRLLELCGTKCWYNIMLDDTYILNGKIRQFLEIMRGDDIHDSFSLVLDSIDTQYSSNRISRSDRGLRYIDDMHEILQTKDNVNCQIPIEWGYIYDLPSDYMKERSTARKQSDIDTLMKMHTADPNNPRYLYYIADSYICMKDWPKALEWFEKRANMENGYSSEKTDALYYRAVISHMFLHKPWSECFDLYLQCFNYDPHRADSLYFVGKHYLDTGLRSVAYMFLKHAFSLGFPPITMSVRKNIYDYHIPNDLMRLCYEEKDYKLGEECAKKILKYNPSDKHAIKHSNIFALINNFQHVTPKATVPQHVIAIIAPGGWKPWDGETPTREGLGGSETFCIGYAEAFARFDCKVLVFCNCLEKKYYNDVSYIPLVEYLNFLGQCRIDTCIISRYSEYIGVTCIAGIPNVYFVLHDLPLVEDIFHIEPNLKKIFCVSNWHKKFFLDKFPICTIKADVISHGIDIESFPIVPKVKHSFIYPSFANRGLKYLLQMFPKIKAIYPDAHLDVFCDMKNSWLLEHHAKEAKEIEEMLQNLSYCVTNHGWVSPIVLKQYWARTHIWLYPCVFPESACVCAYEAAASKTLVVSNNNAALEESVGNRGIVLYGDPRLEAWQEQCINMLKQVIDTPLEQTLIDRNYQWVRTKTFDNVAKDFVIKHINTQI